jgi:hypothetical protein
MTDKQVEAIRLIQLFREGSLSEGEFDTEMTNILESFPPDQRIPFAADVRSIWLNDLA